MTIRPLGADDGAEALALRARALRDHPIAFVSDESSLEGMTAERFAAGFARGTTWGAFLGDALVGTVAFMPEGRAKVRHTEWLVAMYVAPEARGQGVGEALVRAAIAAAQAEGKEKILLGVAAVNDGAKRLYERCGFRTLSLEERCMVVDGVGIDEWTMELRLPAYGAGR